jgi:aminoglycoside phosphotransferase (APT) family kinase protein
VTVDFQPGFEITALDEWIGDRLPGHGSPLQATRMGEGTGEANALYWLRRGRHAWVLRRPPTVLNAPGASDMAREWRILTALEGTAVPHPAPLLLGGPDSPLGTPFLIMERVRGFTPVGVLPAPYDQPDGRRELSFALVDALAELARVPWQACGLEGLGRPAGFLGRQVPRWLHQLDSYQTRDIPGLGWIAGWLEANRPRGAQPALMHGDYSPYNVMASPEDTTRLAAVVDWDTGTIGDPLLDIGHLLARWTEPGEEPAIGVWDIEVREGLPSRAELASRYAERTGADLSALPYYQALALFKLAIILEGSVARRRAATPPDTDAPDTADREAMVDRLIRYAGLYARGERGAAAARVGGPR